MKAELLPAMEEFWKLVRFGLVGVFNTAAGYVLFIVFFKTFGLSYNISNFLSYAIMITLAFILYKNVVFRNTKKSSKMMVASYFLSAVTAFLLNLLALNIQITVLNLSPIVAQIGAMVVYSAIFFLMNRLVVFGR